MQKARAQEQIVLHEVSPTRSPRSTPKTSFVPAHQAAILCWTPQTALLCPELRYQPLHGGSLCSGPTWLLGH